MNKNSKINKSIIILEKIGNKIPHPFWIFINLSIITFVLSYILSENSSQIQINNLCKIEYFINLLNSLPETYSRFKPLPIVIIILMGVSVIQESGVISALIRVTLKRIPVKYLIVAIAVIGVNSNIISDAAVIIVPAISAALFQSLGLNPWLGIIVGYASADSGFTLNMFIAGTDAIISGITHLTINDIGIESNIHPFSNWYFMIIASILFIFLTVWIAENITKKMLNDSDNKLGFLTIDEVNSLSNREKIGLRYFIYVTILFFLVLILFLKYCFSTDLLSISNLSYNSNLIVVLIFTYFILSGVVFGLKTGTMKRIGELPSLFGPGIVGTKSFIITALPASVFAKVLADSNLIYYIGANISYILNDMNLPPPIVLMVFIILIAILNLFITSGSVKWLFIAPLSIPIFLSLGVSANVVQLAYRIGDTSTNMIAPTEYYLPVIISLLEIYKPDKEANVGIGTVISLGLPYAVAYLIGLLILFFIWYFFNLPLGP